MAISIVNQSFSHAETSATPFAIAPTTAGNSLVIAVSVAIAGAVFASIVTNAGDSVSGLPFSSELNNSYDQSGTELTTAVFWIPSGVGGATTMTITCSASFNAWVYEISSNNPPIVVDAAPFMLTALNAAGAGYTPGDTGFINAGNVDATYQIDTVGGSGQVLTYHITGNGTGYKTASGVGTIVGTGGGNGNFTINITLACGVNYSDIDIPGTLVTGPTMVGTGVQDLYIACMTAGQVINVASPWTLDATDIGEGSSFGFGAAFLLNSGSQTAIFNQTSSGRWSVSGAAFKDSGPPPPPALPPCAPVDANSNLTQGVFITDLSLFIGPETALYNDPILPAALASFETTTEGRHAIVLDFNQGDGLYARDLGTVFSWPLIPVGGGPKTVLYVWQPSIIPMPEGIYGRATDWIDGGTPGDKFIQGIQIEADSFNVAKTPILQSSDDLSFHTLLEAPVVFNKQSIRSFSCAPFVAHSARVISTDGIEWRVWQTKLVFEPWPASCLNWQTELTSLGLTGWGHVREMNIAHVSTADLVLVLTFDAWPTITLPITNSSGQQAKVKVTLPVNKFKLMGLQISSTRPFRLFAQDLELKCKQWGTTGSYQILKPFGGPSRAGAVV